jgi:hypothetical protein
VAFVQGAPNYNGMLPNRQIVMVLLQTMKIVMVPIQKTKGFKGPKKNLRAVRLMISAADKPTETDLL